jgi:SAM-dependent methyltransferase
MPLPAQYFDQYADPGRPSRDYASNWKVYGFQIFESYLNALEPGQFPKTVLDVGAADGSTIRELSRRGFDARGIESSPYIYEQAQPDVKDKIAFGDATKLVKELPANSYDALYETAAQYVPKEQLREYLADLARVVKNDLVIVLHTVDYDPKPHDCQVNHLHDVTWRKLLDEAGFEEAGDTSWHPFWFRPKLVVHDRPSAVPVHARVRLEPIKQYKLDEVVENCETFNKASYALYRVLSDAILNTYPKDAMLRGELNVGSSSIERMIERIGKHYLGAELHTLGLPHGTMGNDVSLIVTDRLVANDNALLNQIVSNLFARDSKARELYCKASGLQEDRL